jgi:ubiquitin carboxyl-terminal hydrolase 6/32
MMGTSPMSSFMTVGNGAYEMNPISSLDSLTLHNTTENTSKVTTQTNKMNGTLNSTGSNSSAPADIDDDNISISSSRDNRFSVNYDGQCEYLIAVHRKFTRQDTYFLSHHKTKPSLFGIPLLIPLHDGVQNKDIYCSIWMQVSRLLSPLPPSSRDQSNHAEDCDDSMVSFIKLKFKLYI